MSWSLAGILIVLVGFFTFKLRISNLPSGPKGLPIIGVVPEKSLHLHQQLTKYVSQYGNFFSFNVGRTTALVLSSLEVIEDLLVKRSNIYSSRPTASSQADIVTGKARIVNMPYGEKFRKHRKLIHSLLGMQNAKTFLPYQEYESRQSLKNLLAAPELFFTEMSRYSASVTFSLLIGGRFDRPDSFLPSVIGKLMEKLFNNIRPGAWLVDWVPILDYLPDALAPWRKQARAIFSENLEFWSVFLDAIDSRVKQGTAPDCFVSRFLQSPEIVHFSEVEKVTITAELLTAGTETTGTTLQWFFKAAVKYPEWVKEAQRELDQVVGPDRLPEFVDRNNLPYVNAVISELHRWGSAAPLAFFHATSEADTYRGKQVPKTTIVIPNTYAIHHSDEYFPHHDRFLPGRWLPSDDTRRVLDGAKTPNHLAFGIGRRECPGKHVADAGLYIVISRILWSFDISQGNHPPPSDATAGCLPVLGPARFQCQITPRSENVAQKIQTFSSIIAPDLTVEDASHYENQIRGLLKKYQTTL